MECSRPDPTSSRAPSTAGAASNRACPLGPVRGRVATWPLRSRALPKTIQSSSYGYLQTQRHPAHDQPSGLAQCRVKERTLRRRVLRGTLIQEEHGTIGQVPWKSAHENPFPAFRSILADFAVLQDTENRGAAISMPTRNHPGGLCRVEFDQDDFAPSVPIPYRERERNRERIPISWPNPIVDLVLGDGRCLSSAISARRSALVVPYAGATDLPVEHFPWQVAVIIARTISLGDCEWNALE